MTSSILNSNRRPPSSQKRSFSETPDSIHVENQSVPYLPRLNSVLVLHYSLFMLRLGGHVGAGIDTLLGELGESNLEALLDLLEHLLVGVGADEGDRQTLGSETAGTTDTVEVRRGIAGEIVIDGQVDALDIDTTTENIGGNTDPFLELLELLVAPNTVIC